MTNQWSIQNKTEGKIMKNVNYCTNYPCNGITVDTNHQVSGNFI